LAHMILVYRNMKLLAIASLGMNSYSFMSISFSLTGASALKLRAPSELFDAPLPTHILLYNYGKVASTSQRISFGTLAHSPEIPECARQMSEDYPPRCKTHRINVAKDYIENLPNGSHAWVITTTRNRFNRDIAAYFQQFKHNEFVNRMGNKTVPELQEDFRRRRAGYVDDWFQRNFFDATHVDLLPYAEQVKNSTYVHVERGVEGKRLQILLTRFEDIDHWNEIFGVFFPGFELANSNPVSPGYEDKYIEFLHTYTFSEQEIHATCNGDTMKFYSASEVSAMAPQCSNKQAKAFPEGRARKHREYAHAADAELLQYDVDLDLGED